MHVGPRTCKRGICMKTQVNHLSGATTHYLILLGIYKIFDNELKLANNTTQLNET